MVMQLLKEIAIIGAGQGAPQGDKNYCDNGTPFVKAGNLLELIEDNSIDNIQKVSDNVAKSHKLKLYPKGTVLFAKSGMSCLKGYVYVLPCDAYVVSHLACITPKMDISQYLKYYFDYNKPNKLVKDPAYPSISLSDIGDLKINLKDENERNSIVSSLSKIEEIFSLRKRQLQQLDELVKARFVELFGDPATNPMGWTETTVGEECYYIKDGPHKSLPDVGKGNGYPFISVRNIVNGYIDFSTAKYISEQDYLDSIKKCHPQKGDMLYSKGGTTGIAKLIDVDIEFANWVHVAVLKFRDSLNGVFFEKMLNSDYCYDQSQKLTKGVANRDLVLSAMAKIRIYKPPIELQEQFATFVEQTDKSKFEVQQSLEKLEILKKSLMQQYFG